MMTRTKAVSAGYKSHTGVETGIRELRRFCRDLQKLVIGGCDDRPDEIARHRAIDPVSPEPWVVGGHSERRDHHACKQKIPL
jgi:hypothetical protein